MSKLSAVVLLACLMLAFLGCDRAAVSASGEVDLGVVPDRQVLVSVGSEEVTAGDFRARLAVETCLYAHRYSKQPNFAGRLAAFRQKRVGEILPLLINQKLLSAYLSGEQLALPGADEASLLTAALKKCGWREGIEPAAQEAGVSPDFLKFQLLQPDLINLARAHFDPASTTVSDGEIDEGLARQTAYYERAVASNAVTYVTCSNALAKVRSGEDFALVGAAFLSAADAEEAVRWGDFEHDELDTDEIRQWAFSAPIDSVGGPFELEDGLSIVKILARTEGTLQPSLASEGVADVTLARINFPLVVEEPEPRTREYVRKALLTWKGERAQRNLFECLTKASPLVYPNGTNFVLTVENKVKGE